MDRQIDDKTGIHFYRVDRDSGVSDFLKFAAGPEAPVAEWLNFGSVYADGRRLIGETEVHPGQVLRVHTRRKKFGTPDLVSRIVTDHPDFLVLDKPHGLPTHPTLDNYLENAQQLLQRQLQRKIYVTHRLDVPTAGLLLLAKSPEAQSRINKLFIKGYIGKTYRALTEGPVAPGSYTHFIDPETRVPRAISPQPCDGWWECRLEILTSTPFKGYYVNQIRLLTGKTHQIRAQLAALGEPVLNDVTYGAAAIEGAPGIGLENAALEFRYGGETFNVIRPRSVAGDFICPLK